jgi:hypothetical protein
MNLSYRFQIKARSHYRAVAVFEDEEGTAAAGVTESEAPVAGVLYNSLSTNPGASPGGSGGGLGHGLRLSAAPRTRWLGALWWRHVVVVGDAQLQKQVI